MLPDRLKARRRFQLRNRIDADLPEFPDGFASVNDIEQLPLNVVYSAVRDGPLIIGG
ncbi:hypothetical protein ACFFQF_28735 [Haladaptatus pallidirubidus]|uniref:Uncharacterized protein n=1 Tax=Haladaptatus pallidirubidus TaxID=1008152 RepID=A0AAV3UJK3_9EURY|nr:hypothetical protein [Haladaptatus pallidirubidus]